MPSAARVSTVEHLLSAFAVISYTSNWVYVLFAALGSWIGGFLSITALNHTQPLRLQILSLVDDHFEGRENRRLLIWSLLHLENWFAEFLS